MLVIALHSRCRYVPERFYKDAGPEKLPSVLLNENLKKKVEIILNLPASSAKNIECYLLDSVLKEKSVRHFSVEKYTFQQNMFPATAFNHY